MNDLNMDKLVNFCKQYGFIFQGSEINGGLANTWDFGPVGAELKNNIIFQLNTSIQSHISPC